MAKRPEYTVECFFDRRDGSEPIPWNELSDEEKTEIKKKMSANLSSAMSRYCQTHPEAIEYFRNQ